MKLLTALISTLALTEISIATPTQSPTLRTSPVAVGELAPDFTLEDQSGQKTTLSSARGKTPVVLVFYRGYW